MGLLRLAPITKLKNTTSYVAPFIQDIHSTVAGCSCPIVRTPIPGFLTLPPGAHWKFYVMLVRHAFPAIEDLNYSEFSVPLSVAVEPL